MPFEVFRRNQRVLLAVFGLLAMISFVLSDSLPRLLSAGAGTVSFVGQISGYGNVVEVTHPGGLITRYGHLSAFLAKLGDAVSTGSPIARVGSTGRSTGPHLHFEVRRADNAVDPARYLNAGKILQKVMSG